MANRYSDWYRQAESDLKHSRNACNDGDYDWPCFAAHQAAEKAVKALIEFNSGQFWGHAISKLLEGLKEKFPVPEKILQNALWINFIFKHPLPEWF